MGAEFGNHRIDRDGLIYYSNTFLYNSFRGESTTNLIGNGACESGSLPQNMGVSFEGDLSLVDCPVDKLGFRPAEKAVKFYKNSSSNGRMFTLSNYPTLETGASNLYTQTAYLYVPENSPADVDSNSRPNFGTDNAANSVNGDYINTYSSDKLGKWERIGRNFYSVAGSATQIFRVNSTDPIGSVYYMTKFQTELKSYPSKYINGTRNNTVVGGGGLKDLSGNNLHADLDTNLAFDTDTGRPTLNGTNSYINLGNSSKFNAKNITICAWVKATLFDQANAGIVIKDRSGVLGQFALVSETDGRFRVGFHNGTAQYQVYSSAKNTNQWYFICATFTEYQAKIFVDNDLEGTTSTSSLPREVNSTEVWIGNRAANTANHFNGEVPIVLIYNKILTLSQMKNIHSATKKSFTANIAQ